MSEHRHHSVLRLERESSFTHCVAPKRHNEAAHGNSVVTQTCACGSTRRVAVNGYHVEREPWLADVTASLRELGDRRVTAAATLRETTEELRALLAEGQRQGLAIARMAELAGVSRPTVYQLLSG